MNDDRISELYKGEIWTDALQGRAKRRIQWMCSQVNGDRVLDVGCSQGIASILLAREGFSVTGVDVQDSRIEYARADLEQESADTQAHAEFRVANASDLPFDDASFDSALLGEVMEHLTNPERVLKELSRVVVPGGRIVITTPFGLSPHHDHKQTFYPQNLIDVISSILVVESVDVVERYFRVVAIAEKATPAKRKASALRTFDSLDPVWDTLDKEASNTRQALVAAERRANEADKRAVAVDARWQTKLEETRTDNQKQIAAIRQQLRESEANLAAAKRDLEHRRAAAEKAAAATEAAKTAASKQAERDARSIEMERRRASDREVSLRKRVDRLERDRWKLRSRLATERWRAASLRQRKWSRIGRAIGAVRRNPLRILVLPFDLVSIIFSRSQLPERPKALPRPKKTSTVSGAQAPGPSTVSREAGHDPTAPRLLSLIVEAPASMSLAAPHKPPQAEVRVAAILDEMSLRCFAPECKLITFTPTNWLNVLGEQPPHLLLVESAWQGNDGSWQYKVGTYSHPESVGLPDLKALVDWCRSRSIPTVFWNKEDPVHFEKFKEAAALFDVVFTTDANMAARYRELPEDIDRVVDVLPFAAQPTLHNPIASLQDRDPRPVFAGAFYRNRHPERRAQLEQLLDGAVEHGLVIYDRMNGEVTESFGYPDRFIGHIAGSVPYDEMADVYRRHRVFLNANSVVDSPTMFSRRVFELLASGTPVVSTPSVGVETMFGDVVATVNSKEEASAAIADLLADEDQWLRRANAGVRAVFTKHTYAHRLAKILQVAGVETLDGEPHLSLVTFGESTPWLIAEPSPVIEVLAVNGGTTSYGQSDQPSGWGVATRAVTLSSDNDHVAAKDLARMAEGNWIAFEHPDLNGPVLEQLALGTRIAPTDIVGFAGSSRQEHRFSAELPAGPLLISRDYITRHGWSRNPAQAEALGARIYLVPQADG